MTGGSPTQLPCCQILASRRSLPPATPIVSPPVRYAPRAAAGGITLLEAFPSPGKRQRHSSRGSLQGLLVISGARPRLPRRPPPCRVTGPGTRAVRFLTLVVENQYPHSRVSSQDRAASGRPS